MNLENLIKWHRARLDEWLNDDMPEHEPIAVFHREAADYLADLLAQIRAMGWQGTYTTEGGDRDERLRTTD